MIIIAKLKPTAIKIVSKNKLTSIFLESKGTKYTIGSKPKKRNAKVTCPNISWAALSQ